MPNATMCSAMSRVEREQEEEEILFHVHSIVLLLLSLSSGSSYRPLLLHLLADFQWTTK